MEEALQHETTTQRIGLSPAGPGNHPSDGPKTGDALTFKMDHSSGADQCIKDRGRTLRTGCAEDEIERAREKFAEYLALKYEPARGGRASEVTIGDVLIVYLDEKADSTSRPKETKAAIGRLNEFFGSHKIADIKGKLCRDYAAHRNTASGARRDLEILRAATRHYHKEYGLDVLPAFTLPPKSMPRERYLTRPEAAALLWSALGWEKVTEGTGPNAFLRWRRR